MDRVIDKLKEGYVISFQNVEDFKQCIFELRKCGVSAFYGCDDNRIVECYIRTSTKFGRNDPVAICLYKYDCGFKFGYCYTSWYSSAFDILNYEDLKEYDMDFDDVY